MSPRSSSKKELSGKASSEEADDVSPVKTRAAKKSSADYQREFRRRMRDQGLVKKEVWIRPENAKLLGIVEKQLREADFGSRLGDSDWQIRVDQLPISDALPKPKNRGLETSKENLSEISSVNTELEIRTNDELGMPMSTQTPVPWTTESMFDSLKRVEPFANGDATIELIEGAAPALHLMMHEYGDLPIFVTVAGEQIIVEAALWPLDEVQNPSKFNDAILRSHKFFPLSTISLESVGDGRDYYYMFGALSATSIISNIVFEIEVLAFNVIQAAEAYSEFLAEPQESV